MNSEPLTTIQTPRGNIIQLVVTNRKRAQHCGVTHFIGFAPKSGNSVKMSFTGVEI